MWQTGKITSTMSITETVNKHKENNHIFHTDLLENNPEGGQGVLTDECLLVHQVALQHVLEKDDEQCHARLLQLAVYNQSQPWSCVTWSQHILVWFLWFVSIMLKQSDLKIQSPIVFIINHVIYYKLYLLTSSLPKFTMRKSCIIMYLHCYVIKPALML